MKKDKNYVNNEDFLVAMVEYNEKVKELALQGIEAPILPNYIGKCLYDICNNFSYRPNFINYSYRQEMVGDALESCFAAVGNFDPEKSKNPFGYFTQIAFFAFLNRIGAEHKEAYVKAKMLETAQVDEIISYDAESLGEEGVAFVETMRENYYFDTKAWEDKRKSKSKKKEPKVGALEEFME